MFYNVSMIGTMDGVAMKLLAASNSVSVRGSNWLNPLHLTSLTAPYCENHQGLVALSEFGVFI